MAGRGQAGQGKGSLFVKMKKRHGDWIQTSTDRQFWPLDPRPSEVYIFDIAAGLANTCRYGGQLKPENWMSVATHSVLVSRWLHRQGRLISLWGLLHDAAEAYIGDATRPVKRTPEWAGYRRAEARIMAAVCDRFGLPHEEPAVVVETDRRLLLTERAALRGPPPVKWEAIYEALTPLPVAIPRWGPREGRDKFLARFSELYTEA